MSKKKKILKNRGIFEEYMKLNLNERCFAKYSSLMEFSSEIKKLNNYSVEDLLKMYEKGVKRCKVKIPDLVLGYDFKFICNVREYKVIELLSQNSFFKEGELMKNCLGTKEFMMFKNKRVFSLRSLNNKPVLNFSIDNSRNLITDIKGPCNKEVEYELIKILCKEMSLRYYPKTSYLVDQPVVYLDWLYLGAVISICVLPVLLAFCLIFLTFMRI